jgi:hypothetical protein
MATISAITAAGSATTDSGSTTGCTSGLPPAAIRRARRLVAAAETAAAVTAAAAATADAADGTTCSSCGAAEFAGFAEAARSRFERRVGAAAFSVCSGGKTESLGCRAKLGRLDHSRLSGDESNDQINDSVIMLKKP